MEYGQNQETRKQLTIRNIEEQIRNNQFSSKDTLVEYLLNLKNNGMSSTLDNKKIQELLDLFDSLNKKEELPLDMKNYASIGLENQDLIVSKQTDRILTTLEGTSAFSNEFKQTQNEIIANNKDGLVNADDTFVHMANYQKEEKKLVPLSEAILLNNIKIEILNKIRFFITNSYINPYSFKVNIQDGTLYNTETSEVYEVRKNLDTNQYEIFKGSEKIYGSDTKESSEDNLPQLTSETNQEQMAYEQRLNKPKVKVRRKENETHIGNAAFTKIGLLITNIITFGLLIATAIFLYK